MSTKVTIGIQARSTSNRLPGKVFEIIGHKTVLKHVVDACFKSARYINNYSTKDIFVDVAICIPFNDPIKTRKYGEATFIEGPEDDVLSRYVLLCENHQSDYIVRITGDCPFIPDPLITKCINTTVRNAYDYFSNVDERSRTAPDGFDCEVFSKRLLLLTHHNATLLSDREHVTTFMRREDINDFKYGVLLNDLDRSHIKLSLDTVDDLDDMRREYERVEKKYDIALNIFGRGNVHKF